MNQIIVYGTTYCSDCTFVKRVLQQQDIPYAWINIEHDPEGWMYVEAINEGMMSVPVLRFPDGSILVEPSGGELMRKLNRLRNS